MTRYMRGATGASRPTTSCGAGRSRPRGLLGLDLGVASSVGERLRHGARRRARCRARSGSRARRSTTPSTRFRGKRRRRASAIVARAASCASSPSSTWGELREPGRRASRPGCARSASSAATASSPTCRTSPRPSPPSSPRAVARRGLVELLAGLRRAQRDRPLRADRAEGAARGRRLPLRRQGLRPPRDRRGHRTREVGARARAARLPRRLGLAGRLPRTTAELEFERVPFDHPLWVLYSSGTTGLPKAIVQGQGGILLEHLKKLAPARRRAGRATASSGSPRPAG